MSTADLPDLAEVTDTRVFTRLHGELASFSVNAGHEAARATVIQHLSEQGPCTGAVLALITKEST